MIDIVNLHSRTAFQNLLVDKFLRPQKFYRGEAVDDYNLKPQKN